VTCQVEVDVEDEPYVEAENVAPANVPKSVHRKGDALVPSPVQISQVPELLALSRSVHEKFELDVLLGFVQVTVSLMVLVAEERVPGVADVGVPTPVKLPKVEQV
jgi:hypothetical protein